MTKYLVGVYIEHIYPISLFLSISLIYVARQWGVVLGVAAVTVSGSHQSSAAKKSDCSQWLCDPL